MLKLDEQRFLCWRSKVCRKNWMQFVVGLKLRNKIQKFCKAPKPGQAEEEQI